MPQIPRPEAREMEFLMHEFDHAHDDLRALYDRRLWLFVFYWSITLAILALLGASFMRHSFPVVFRGLLSLFSVLIGFLTINRLLKEQVLISRSLNKIKLIRASMDLSMLRDVDHRFKKEIQMDTAEVVLMEGWMFKSSYIFAFVVGIISVGFLVFAVGQFDAANAKSENENKIKAAKLAASKDAGPKIIIENLSTAEAKEEQAAELKKEEQAVQAKPSYKKTIKMHSRSKAKKAAPKPKSEPEVEDEDNGTGIIY